MVQISIIIDDNNKVTVNQSVSSTKVEKSKSTIANKVYFIVMCDYDNESWVELVTEDFNEARFTVQELEKYSSHYDKYRILMQKNGSIMPCNGADFDIDSL